jgi:hypothetical protein
VHIPKTVLRTSGLRRPGGTCEPGGSKTWLRR